MTVVNTAVQWVMTVVNTAVQLVMTVVLLVYMGHGSFQHCCITAHDIVCVCMQARARADIACVHMCVYARAKA